MMADGRRLLRTRGSPKRRKLAKYLKARPLYAGQQNGHAIVDNAHYEEFAKRLEAEKTGCGDHAVADRQSRGSSRDTNLAYNAWHASKAKFALVLLRSVGCEDTLQFSPNRTR